MTAKPNDLKISILPPNAQQCARGGLGLERRGNGPILVCNRENLGSGSAYDVNGVLHMQPATMPQIGTPSRNTSNAGLVYANSADYSTPPPPAASSVSTTNVSSAHVAGAPARRLAGQYNELTQLSFLEQIQEWARAIIEVSTLCPQAVELAVRIDELAQATQVSVATDPVNSTLALRAAANPIRTAALLSSPLAYSAVTSPALRTAAALSSTYALSNPALRTAALLSSPLTYSAVTSPALRTAAALSSTYALSNPALRTAAALSSPYGVGSTALRTAALTAPYRAAYGSTLLDPYGVNPYI